MSTIIDVPDEKGIINKDRLFLASCVALVVTAMTFAIRAGIMNELAADFGFTDVQLGWINSMAFWGFPVATIIGGLVYNRVGPRNMMYAAFFFHVLGLVLTMMANSYALLMISTFFVGFANGAVEAACNPMIADMYHTNKTTMLNRFHVWFPGGIVVGALLGEVMGSMEMAWQIQIAVMLIPTVIYGVLIFGQKFPVSANIVSDTSENIRGVFTPLFLFIAALMTLTAISEFGPQQWVERTLAASGAQPLLVLALVTGVMALGRFFAGPLVHRLNPPGVLLMSAVIACIGIYLMSSAEGAMVYVSALLFAVGICYFWPTMIGLTAEYTPKTGALGMSLVGGAGMASTAIWNPIIGGWIDENRTEAIASGLSGDAADLAAGQAALSQMAIFPAILIVAFIVLYFLLRNRHEVSADEVILNDDAMAAPGSAR